MHGFVVQFIKINLWSSILNALTLLISLNIKTSLFDIVIKQIMKGKAQKLFIFENKLCAFI